MDHLRCISMFFLIASFGGNAVGQPFNPTNQELYVSGQLGYANGNCVKASRYWFAYLLRNPPELQTDPTRRAKLENVIAICDATPLQYAYTTALFDLKKPTKKGRCEKYAEMAIAQYEAANLANCRFSGPRWSDNRMYHYNWCIGANDLEPDSELNTRKRDLGACVPSQ